ncbi:hypothetical protein NCC49_003028 [Naganishia albida]|nr:hypothetical protein NCC49_003028 [Naganishia albida]
MDAHRIQALPPSAWYIEDFVSEAEEEYLLKKIAESPVPRWKTTPTGRRLQYLGGTLTKTNILIPEPLPKWCTEFPDLINRITSTTDVFRSDADEGTPNQVLINEYEPGQGIAPHEDGPAYHPAVATISLGSPQCVDIYQYLSTTDPSPPLTATPDTVCCAATTTTTTTTTTEETPERRSANGKEGRTIAKVPLARVYLAPRSLLVMSSALYTTHLHGISEITEDIITSLPATEDGTTAGGPVPTHPEGQTPDDTTASGGGRGRTTAVPIANLGLLAPEIQRTVRDTGSYASPRGTRVSLTFRRVGRVMKGGALGGKVFGKR